MASHTIFMSNLGYLRGINGCLADHIRYAHRHIYCSPAVQKKLVDQATRLIEEEDPDICCFVEIEKGASLAPGFNQLEALATQKYPYFDIENKYGPTSRLRHFPLTRNKSNGFLSKRQLPYEKVYFTHGTKKLIYKIELEPQLTLFFAHFSLKQVVREQQLLQVKEMIHATPGEVIFLGDFNIHAGFKELAPLLHENRLVVLNREDEHTFKFHKYRMALDLCICSQSLADNIRLRIVPQLYSDHEALVVHVAK